MPDQDYKLVKTDSHGIVAFPNHYSDDKILSVLRKHRKNPLTTEESEHARQLKATQPLNTAIPSWATEPLVPKIKSWEASHIPLEKESQGWQKSFMDAFSKRHPIAAGIYEGQQKFGESMTSPINIAMMVAAPESKLLSGIFSFQAARGAFADAKAAHDAYLKGNNKEAAQYATEAILGAGLGATAGAHAIEGFPAGQLLKGEEGSLTYKAADASQPFFLKSEKLLEDKMKGPMPADDIHKMLLANGVKPEEMKWTGLDEFLTSKGKEKITPQEMQQHIASHDLAIHEVQKGQPKPTKWTKMRDGIFTTPEGYKIERIDSNGKYRATSTSGIVQLFDTVDEAKAKVDYWRKNSAEDEVMPKFSSYQLPGGHNYREMLFTMSPQPPKELESVIQQYQEALDKSTALRDRIEETGHAGPNADRLMAEFKAARNEVDRIGKQLNALKVSTNQFRSNHWEEPNVLGHIRFNDRTGPNGERILHLEELQSDWHQKGRAKGYREPKITKLPNGYKVSPVPKGQYEGLFEVLDPNGKYVSSGTNPEDAVFFALERLNEHNQEQSVPDAPFKKNWHELMLKRMMRYAAEHGYDGISWTPGEQQAERYDLSKQVSELRYRKQLDGDYHIVAYLKEGGRHDMGTVSASKLADTVGKEVAQKIENGEGESSPGDRKRLVGEDLKVGGEGMKGFYDKIVPDAANRIGKQWGTKVGETNFVTETRPKKTYVGPSYTYEQLKEIADQSKGTMIEGSAKWVADSVKNGSSLEEAMDAYGSPMFAEKLGGSIDVVANKKSVSVPYIPITPEMRKSITSQPMSLFGMGTAQSLANVRAEGERRQKESSLQHEDAKAEIPPELERIKKAFHVRLKVGKPYGDAVASVGQNEPNVIEINDPKRFAQGEKQTISHELTHLLFNNLAGPVRAKIPPDNARFPYDISHVDELRKKGYKLWNLPQEVAATVVQTWVANPSERERLQPWISDFNDAPLSVEEPTPPGSSQIVMSIRPPLPPPQTAISPEQVKAKAAELQHMFRRAGMAR